MKTVTDSNIIRVELKKGLELKVHYVLLGQRLLASHFTGIKVNGESATIETIVKHGDKIELTYS